MLHTITVIVIKLKNSLKKEVIITNNNEHYYYYIIITNYMIYNSFYTGSTPLLNEITTVTNSYTLNTLEVCV